MKQATASESPRVTREQINEKKALWFDLNQQYRRLQAQAQQIDQQSAAIGQQVAAMEQQLAEQVEDERPVEAPAK